MEVPSSRDVVFSACMLSHASKQRKHKSRLYELMSKNARAEGVHQVPELDALKFLPISCTGLCVTNARLCRAVQWLMLLLEPGVNGVLHSDVIFNLTLRLLYITQYKVHCKKRAPDPKGPSLLWDQSSCCIWHDNASYYFWLNSFYCKSHASCLIGCRDWESQVVRRAWSV